MANVREMLGRLNAKTVRFDVGRGGVSELSDQDIAAALAFVPPGLGREVLAACWWPPGMDRRRLMDAVLAAVSAQWREQADRLSEARTELGIAEACAGWHRHQSAEMRREVERARSKYERVRDECWPRDMGQMLPALVGACLTEIAYRHACPECEGRGERQRGELRVSCSKCLGTGVVSVSERSRAGSIGRHVETYRRHWAAPYEWLLALLTEAEQGAANQLMAALRRDAA